MGGHIVEFNFSNEPGRVLFNRFNTDELPVLASVITPYFNSGKDFEQTFNCVLNQTFPYFEWIIVNDARTNEENKQILLDLAEKDKRIKIFHTGELSISAARNFAISKSQGEIIIPMDSDDLIEPNYFECLYWSLYCKPEASWSYSDSVTFSHANFVWRQPFSSKKMKEENILVYSGAIRKKDLEEVGCYSELDSHFNEDWELWLKLLSKKKFPVHLSNIGFWYRWTNTGALARFQNDSELVAKQKKIVADFSKNIENNIKAITFDSVGPEKFIKPYKWAFEEKLNFKQDKIKILMLLPHMERGGADKFNLDLIANIDKNKFEIGIITTVFAESEWRQLFSEFTPEIFELPKFLDRSDWSAFIHYYIKSRNVNIVMNISSYSGYYLIPWLRKEFNQIAIIDCIHAEGKYWRAGGYPRISGLTDCLIEKTFSTNDFTRKIMVSKYGKDASKADVLYTGVDHLYFNPDLSYSNVRKELNISKDQPVILYLCRISAEKRPFLMLEIAEKMRTVISNICFIVVGEGPQSDEFKQKIKEKKLQKTVKYVGKSDDIRQYYACSDLFLLCSIKEGLSITTFEAMAMRVPVVSSDVGGQNELVDNTRGRLLPCLQDEALDFDSREFPADEINSYVLAITELLKNKENLQAMGKLCRERILNGFTLEQMIAKFEKEAVTLLDEEHHRNREILSDKLCEFSGIFDEYLTIYNAFERYDSGPGISFGGTNNFEFSGNMPSNGIENLRSYRLLMKYQHFMLNTKAGRFLNRFKRLAFRILRKIKRIIKR